MTTISCEQLVDLLADFLSNDLPVEIEAAFRAHVGVCPHCGDYVGTFQLTIRITRLLPKCEAPLPSGFEAKLRAKIAEAQK